MATKAKKGKAKGRTTLLNELHDRLLNVTEVTRSGSVKIRRAALKSAIEEAFQTCAVAAASGERVRFPIIGALVRKDVKPRKAGKGVNPFTGEEVTLKARPASKKPRWSFPKTLKETFANRRYW
jgi:nucleoid DNA-binding protein